MSGLTVKDIEKTFHSGVKALDKVSFSIAPGEIRGFIGPNGAGKTTTMRIIATIETMDGGDVSIGGYSIKDKPYEARKLIGFVPDYISGLELTTVYECLDFFARAYALNSAERQRRIDEILDFLVMGDLKDKLISELSRGMQQRVSLARALVNDPKVLLLDEPAANLDPSARIELRKFLRAIAEKGKAVLISSHILSELSSFCDSYSIINKGELLISGSLEEIKKSMSSDYKHVVIRTLPFHEEDFRKLLSSLPAVPQLERCENNLFFINFNGDDKYLAEILAHLVKNSVPVVEVNVEEMGIEDVFMKITSNQ